MAGIVEPRLSLTSGDVVMSQPGEGMDDLAALMRLAQEGDRAAYERLLRDCAGRVRNYLRQNYPFVPQSDIEDLVQDVLLSLHAVRATYDAARPFLPWLMAIVRNRTADMARRYARRNSREIAVDEYPETFDPHSTNRTEDAYGDPEALRKALGALPRGQRVAIELLKLREMSLKDAARESGMSVAALKVASHRATRALRLALKHRDG